MTNKYSIGLDSTESKRQAVISKMLSKSKISSLNICLKYEKNDLWKLCSSPCNLLSIMCRTVKLEISDFYHVISSRDVLLFRQIGRTNSLLKQVNFSETTEFYGKQNTRQLVNVVAYLSKAKVSINEEHIDKWELYVTYRTLIKEVDVLHLIILLKSENMEKFILNENFNKCTNHNIRKIFGTLCERYNKLDKLLGNRLFNLDTMRKYIMFIK